MTEEWRPIPGYEGRYDISDQGRVRSWLPHHGQQVPRILVTPVGGVGYRVVRLSDAERIGKTWNVHHLVATTFIGPKSSDQHVRHLDGDKQNNVVANLAIGSPSENMRDKRRHGTDHNVNKTHCPRGHEYTPENTGDNGIGGRVCRTCSNARNRQRVACDECGAPVPFGRKAQHKLFHHSDRPFGRVYVRQPIPHGTDSGYNTHLKRGEAIPPGDPCGCRAAHAAKVRERSARRRLNVTSPEGLTA